MRNNYDTTIIDKIITGYLPHKIYAFETGTNPNYLKVGDTTRPVDVRLNEWRTIYNDLVKRFEVDAMLEDENGERNIFFRDYALHKFLINEKNKIRLSNEEYEKEFFGDTDIYDLAEGITDINNDFISNGVRKYNYYKISDRNTQIVDRFERSEKYQPRPNQLTVINNIVTAVSAGRTNLLLYAVMRFGKSTVAIWAAKELKSMLTVIVTGKADVKTEWQKTVESHVDFENFVFTDTMGYTDSFIENNKNKQIVVFATLQDLSGSRDSVKSKHQLLFSSLIDLLVIDESHFGARAKIYRMSIEGKPEDDDYGELSNNDFNKAIDTVNSLKSKIKLHLSGTPYRILLSGEFYEEDIVGKIQYTDILKEKYNWSRKNIALEEEKPEENDYYGFPEMVRFAFNPNESSIKLLQKIKESGESAELNVLFEPLSKKKNESKTTTFKHEEHVLKLLYSIDGKEEDDNVFPFLNYEKIKNGKLAKHIVFVLPYKNSVDAMERLIAENKQNFLNLGDYEIINVAGNTSKYENAADVQSEIKKWADRNVKTITLTVNKMLTGSTVPEWDTMVFLKDTKSPQEYDQAIFRLQSPWIKNIKDAYTGVSKGKEDMKPQTLLVDFSPNRLFKIESDKAIVVNASEQKTGNEEQEKQLANFMEYSPIIYMNNKKLKEVTPVNIIDKIREYSAEKSIIEEVMDIPVDESLYKIPEFLSEIERQYELGSRTSFETKASKGNDTNYDGNVNEKNKKDSGHQNDFTRNENSSEEILNEIPTVKQMQMYYSRILLYAFLSPEKVNNLSDVISSLERHNRLGTHLEIKKLILEVIKQKINPYILANLDNKIKNTRDLREESNNDGGNILKGISKFGRISAEEIFTPLWIAEKMVNNVIDEEFINKYKENPTKIIDITSKSGVYLIMVYNKLVDGGIPSEIVKNNLFAVATSDLSYEFTRATYEEFEWNLNHLISSDELTSFDLINSGNAIEKLKKVFRGEVMDFDVVIGNPPYQSKTKKLLYPDFYLLARELGNTVSLIFPTSWQEPKNNNGLQKLNKSHIKEDAQIVSIDNNQHAFPGVAGAEWTNIIIWKKNYDNGLNGKQNVYTNGKNLMIKKLLLDKSEIEKPREIKELVKHVKETDSFESIKSVTSARKPYGLTTDFLKKASEVELSKVHNERTDESDIKVYTKSGNYVFFEAYFPFPRKGPAFENYKVFIPDAWGNMSNGFLGGAYSNIIIASPHEATLGTYIESGNFSNAEMAKKHAKYFMTKFFRALLFANKHSIINSTAWESVPVQNYEESFWSESIEVIDEALFEKYSIPLEIKEYVYANIQSKLESNIINFEKS